MENKKHVYELVTTMMAPEGAFTLLDETDPNTIDLVMYVSVWKDETGMIYEIPMPEWEIREIPNSCNDIQEYLNDTIPCKRMVRRRLTCHNIVNYAGIIMHNEKDRDTATDSMRSWLDKVRFDVSAENIKATPEAADFLRKGNWNDFRTMENDGTLGDGWQEAELDGDNIPKTAE